MSGKRNEISFLPAHHQLRVTQKAVKKCLSFKGNK
jgi:hypothetical protein